MQISVEKFASLLSSTLREMIGPTLNSVELQGEMLEFGVNSMRFVIDLQTLTVGRVASESHPFIGTDNVSRLVQTRLREKMQNVLGRCAD